jgi:hypothetical protein
MALFPAVREDAVNDAVDVGRCGVRLLCAFGAADEERER